MRSWTNHLYPERVVDYIREFNEKKMVEQIDKKSRPVIWIWLAMTAGYLGYQILRWIF